MATTVASRGPTTTTTSPSTVSTYRQTEVDDDVDGQRVKSKYAPVQKSVELVSDRIRSSQRLQSALALAVAYLPTVVTDLSVAGAGRLQVLGSTYATPLVARVDDKISSALETILQAPSYGQAKVVAADQFAFNYTPEILKPTYTRTKTRAIQVVQGATSRVVQLKRERAEPLWEALVQRLDNVQKRIAQVRAAIGELKSNAVETVQAIAHLDRLNELNARLQAAVAAARSKGEQAREFSKELVAGVTEAATHLTAFVESNLTEQQQATVRALWARLVEAVATLKEALHLSSSSQCEAESTEGVPVAVPVAAQPAASSTAGVAAAPSVATSVSADQTQSTGASKFSSSNSNGSNGTNGNGEHLVVESSLDGTTNDSNSSPKRKPKRKAKSSAQDDGNAEA